MTAIATRPIKAVSRSGNGSTPPQATQAPSPATAPLDEALAVLQAHQGAWAATDVDQRIALLAEVRQRTAAISERWVGAIVDAKGTVGDVFGVGEEWTNYSLVLRWMRILQRSLQDIQRHGRPKLPGRPRSQRNVREQALHLATWLVLNAGCNCLTERVIVQQREWPQREALLDAMGDILAHVPTHRAYYPGAAERYAAFVDAHPDARRFGDPQPGHLPWTLISGVDPDNADDICFTTEAFCSLMAETGLPASDPAEFLDRAVQFANNTLWGTLGATIIVHPRSLAEPRVAAALDRALATLRYGTITVNHWLGYAYYFGLSPWGAYPGSDCCDVQSGIGMANNALMLADAQKSVYRAPFHKLVDPYTLQSRRIVEFGRRFAAYDGSGSLAKFASLLWTSLRC